MGFRQKISGKCRLSVPDSPGRDIYLFFYHLCNMKIRIIRFLAMASMMLFSYCANMKAPGGGPTDIYPPFVTESDPPNYSLHFKEKKIILKFNEFVNVTDVINEVFISPPLNKTPDIRTRGKSVIITIDEELHDSTTYSIYFGKSIKDITEGNPMENYNYVFSTGDWIDSLSVIGEVIDAFDLKPRKDVLVMLYEDNNDTISFDSLPYRVKPSYLTRTTEQGFFILNNLRKSNYLLFALADINFSATYDLAEEDIAFLDSLITPEFLLPDEMPDSLFTDSLLPAPAEVFDVENDREPGNWLNDAGEELMDGMANDTALSDTSTMVSDSLRAGFYTLFMFVEVDTLQRLLGADKPRDRVLRFVFLYQADDVLVTPLTAVPENWMLPEWNKTLDTLRYYVLSESLDSVSLMISLDTMIFDTVKFMLREDDMLQGRKDKDQALKLSSNARPTFPFHETFRFSTGAPLTYWDFSRFLLVEDADTIIPELEVFGQAGRKVRLNRELKENTSYTLFFPDSLLTDMYGHSNDSVTFNWRTNARENYGSLVLHLHNLSNTDQLLIQLINDKGKVLREETMLEETTLNWELLEPGKYVVKAFGDKNLNGRWDPGSFVGKRQPEPVVFFPLQVDIRANWNLEEDWEIRFR